jgi:hypothetical protein
VSAGLDTRPNAVTFDLEDLVEKAWGGQIRIPHFQRPFRWGREDIRRLFDSVLRGYPIGSVLLWLRPAPEQDLVLGNLHIAAPRMDRTWWVVDGQQRITSLANALHPEAATDPRFALGYNLESEQFETLRPGSDRTVPLPVLFDLEKLIHWFDERPEKTRHLKAASAAAKAIRQFRVPAYEVEQRDVSVLQDIFDRLNNYGKRLRRDEIFSALTAGVEEGSVERIDLGVIAENIDAERGFGILDRDTVMRAILARRNSDVLRDIRHEFDSGAESDFPGEDRDAAFELAQDAILRAVEFLQRDAKVPHLHLVPYRSLVVVISRFFSHFPELSEHDTRMLRRWFWRAVVVGPDGFKGGSTGALRAMCIAIRPGELVESLRRLLALIPSHGGEWPDLRRFRATAAPTRIMLCSWWADSPMSPETGEYFDEAILADGLTGRSSVSDGVREIIPRRDVPDNMRGYASNRVFMPYLATVDSEVAPILLSCPDNIPDESWIDILDSHAISIEMVALLRHGRYVEFLNARFVEIDDRLVKFLRLMCEWEFEDTPSLSELDFDDESEGDDDFPA